MPRVKHNCFWIAVCFLFLLIAISFSPSAKCEDNTNQLNLTVTLYIYINDVNLQNHTITTDIIIEISGIKPLIVGGQPQAPENVSVQLDDLNLDEINFQHYHDYGNETYDVNTDRIQGLKWYLYSLGEGYPYDINQAIFRLSSDSLFYSINGTNYGTQPQWNYSSKVVGKHAEFSGQNKADLEGTWEINLQSHGHQLDVYLSRHEVTPNFIIMIPLFFILALMIYTPNLCDERKTKREIYLAMLVFLPMFLFAIESFIPPRNSPSIPEFLVIILMLLATYMVLISLVEINKRLLCFIETLTFVLVLVGFVVIILTYFQLLLSISPNVQIALFGFELLLVLAVVWRSLPLLKKNKKKKKKEVTTYSGFDGDY